jgi:ABC-type amino acid transport substrate-binding protein
MKRISKFIILGLCVVLVISLLAGCSQPKQEQQAVDQPKAEQPKEEKKEWVVGTSADYPPFESVDEKGEFVGFDMDLIREVGKRMGVEVKIVSMEFDSLIASLKQGKVDAVIACMSPTPARLEEADFTDAYYLTKNAVLIKPDGKVEVKTIEDVFKYEIAVQTGTTMDEWATQQVKDGKIKESQLKRYTDANVAAMDVKNGRIEAFIADLPVAYEKANELDLKVAIEYKINQSGDAGILLKKGSDEMLQKLNEIIKEMKDDGFLGQLEDKWLKK